MNKIDKGTIIRTAIALLAIINNGLLIYGKHPLPITNDGLEQFINFVFSSYAMWLVWWKNNDFTKEAQGATKKMRQAKADKKKILE